MKNNPEHNLFTIYNLLFKKFGQQHWWPGESKEEIIIGAILTQNTNWQNVEKSIYNLRLNNLIDFASLVRIEEQKLAEIIRSSGYYNQKSKRLKLIVKFFTENPFAIFENIPTEEFRKMLLGIIGIGPETADSILLYAFNRPVFVIDAYTKRIFNRLKFWSKEVSYKEAQYFFMKNLKPDVNLFNEYHALLVKLGKEYCKKIPKCLYCPLKTICDYKKDSHQTIN
jgi:endonuclease-3 related protein